MPVGSSQSGSFGSALWRGCVYGIFQLTAIGLMYQHVRGMKSEKEVAKSMIYMFVIDAAVMEPAVFGLLAVAYQPELSGYSVPMLLLVKTGVGKTVLTPLISLVKTGYSYIGYETLIVPQASQSRFYRKVKYPFDLRFLRH
jgi:hypothetical protein